ncbi:MAG: InlB B-repeat-containing protein, partial [Desulfuromonadaceae bacterium]
VYIQDPSGNNVVGTLAPTSDASAFTFTASVPYAYSNTYKLYVTSGAKDASGNGLNTSGLPLLITTRAATHTVTLTSVGNGTVTSNAADLAKVTDGTDVIFTITPSTGHHLVDVKLDGTTQVVTGNSYILNNVIINHTVTVTFAINTYTLASSVIGENGTVITSNSTPSFGDSPSVSIIPATGYILDILTDNGVDVSGSVISNVYTISSISQNRTVVASFRKLNLVVTQPESGTGTVALSGTTIPVGTVYILYGGSQTFDIIPANGYVLSSITYNGAAVSPVPTLTSGKYVYSVTSVSTDSTLKVAFKLVKYFMTMTTDGNGSISSPYAQIDSATGKTFVNYNGSATFTVQSKPGFVLKTMMISGVPVATTLISQVKDAVTGKYQYTYSYILTGITTDITVDATFEAKYTISATSGTNGSISPSGTQDYLPGTSPAYTFTPASDQYQVASVLVDGIAVTPIASSYTFTNLAIDHTIAVTFGSKQFTVAAAPGTANGSILPLSTVVQFGGSVDVTITPLPGYYIKDILKKIITDPASGTASSVLEMTQLTVSGDRTLKLSDIRNNYEISAVFEKKTFIISTTPLATGGTITASTTTPEYNGSVIFTISPDSGYNLLDLTDNGASVKSRLVNNKYELNNITADHIVLATFTGVSSTITSSVNNAAFGSITPSGTTRVNYGASQKYQITATAGAVLDDLLVDGVSNKGQVDATGAYTFSNVTAAHTIVANFIAAGTVAYPDGDINDDKKTDIADALLALKMSVGIITPTAAEKLHGDVGPMNNLNKPVPDGKIDIDDVVVLLQRAVGNIPAW